MDISLLGSHHSTPYILLRNYYIRVIECLNSDYSSQLMFLLSNILVLYCLFLITQIKWYSCITLSVSRFPTYFINIFACHSFLLCQTSHLGSFFLLPKVYPLELLSVRVWLWQFLCFCLKSFILLFLLKEFH